MSRTQRREPRDKHNKHNPRKDNMYRRSKQYTNGELRKKHVYVPPQQSLTKYIATNLENHDPTRPFTLAPCESCGSNEHSDKCTDHKRPIIIAISSSGKKPAACGVFCNMNSIYNTTFMPHDDNLEHRRIILHAAVAALETVAAFMAARPKKRDTQTKDITQIIIKTSSSWLVDGFAASTEHYRFKGLSNKFDHLVDELGEYTGVAARWLGSLLKQHSGDGRLKLRSNQRRKKKKK